MNGLYIILGCILTVLFFLNIKNAADVLCRIIGGFAVLIIYNIIAETFSLHLVGINFISALIAGTLGFPGAILLLCALLFL